MAWVTTELGDLGSLIPNTNEGDLNVIMKATKSNWGRRLSGHKPRISLWELSKLAKGRNCKIWGTKENGKSNTASLLNKAQTDVACLQIWWSEQNGVEDLAGKTRISDSWPCCSLGGDGSHPSRNEFMKHYQRHVRIIIIFLESSIQGMFRIAKHYSSLKVKL